MGHVIEISPKLDIEIRRESYRLVPLEEDGSIEMHFDTVFALEAAVKEIQKSLRFRRWLAKMEDRKIPID